MKAQAFIVIGRYDSERNSWIEGGDIRHLVSGHHSERAAWRAAERAHSDLGGCDGSSSLTDVMRKFAPLDSRKAQEFIAKTQVWDSEGSDYYESQGWLYVPCDFWAAHEVYVAPGGLGLALR